MQLLIIINTLYYSIQKSHKKAKTTPSKSKGSASATTKAITVKKPVIYMGDFDETSDGALYAIVHTSLYHILTASFTVDLIMHLRLVLMMVLMRRR